ncbi:MAG: hypothetical protein AAFV93_25150 [Chloroflexota bacterium]
MSQEPLVVTELPNGIVEMRFTEVSRAAVNTFLKSVLEPQETINVPLILVDSRVGIQPIRYTFAKLQDIFKEAPSLQNIESPVYVAIVLDDTVFSSVAINFVRTLNLKNVNFQFFAKERYDDAMEWLLSQEDLVSTNESATN